MITNNHIAMQLAVERQRDLRTAGSAWHLTGFIARPAAKRPGTAVEEGDAAPAVAAAPRSAMVPARDPHLPEPRIRRTPAGRSASWRPSAPRHGSARESERTGS